MRRSCCRPTTLRNCGCPPHSIAGQHNTFVLLGIGHSCNRRDFTTQYTILYRYVFEHENYSYTYMYSFRSLRWITSEVSGWFVEQQTSNDVCRIFFKASNYNCYLQFLVLKLNIIFLWTYVSLICFFLFSIKIVFEQSEAILAQSQLSFVLWILSNPQRFLCKAVADNLNCNLCQPWGGLRTYLLSCVLVVNV